MDNGQGRFKVYRIVEYVKGQEYPFDTHDEVDDVLGYFGVGDGLTDRERAVLVVELERLAEDAQTREIARLVMGEIDKENEGWEHGC